MIRPFNRILLLLACVSVFGCTPEDSFLNQQDELLESKDSGTVTNVDELEERIEEAVTDFKSSKPGKPFRENEVVYLDVLLVEDDKIEVTFLGRIQPGIKLSPKTEKQDFEIQELIAQEFSKEPSLKGVVIKAGNGVKHLETTRIFSAIKKGLNTVGTEKPIYISVADTKAASEKVEDEE